MGNNLGGRKKAKVMKINGETIKFKTPIRSWDVLKDYPGHVLLESETVKQFGIRAKPLEPQQDLKPRKIYFLVELPKFPVEDKAPRRVRSGGIHMSARDRLECLMLSRRSVSDLTTIRKSSSLMINGLESESGSGSGSGSGEIMTVKMRLPKSQMAKLVEESKDDGEVAEKILNLYVENDGAGGGGDIKNDNRISRENGGVGGGGGDFKGKREKRVSFIPQGGEIRIANHL